MTGKTILIIGGGTGGHISPGVALYEEFKENKINALLLCNVRDKRFSLINEIPRENVVFYNAPSLSKNIIKIPFFILFFLSAILRAKSIIRKNEVDAVVGMGGYVSAPALIAAGLRKVPIFLCEQNSVPGKVTTFFEKKCRKVYATFMDSKKYIKDQNKFLCAGNPIRKSILNSCDIKKSKARFNLGHCSKIILVLGGSQGALKINQLIYGLKKDYPDELRNVGIIWSTGERSYDNFKTLIHDNIDKGSIYISPYIDDVGSAYCASNIAISRAGAGVMVELAAAGIPSILIPYPHAKMNHQEKNADAYVEKEAAIKIKDSDAVPEKVAVILFNLLNNSRMLNNMSENAREISKKNASAVIVKDIMEELGCSENL